MIFDYDDKDVGILRLLSGNSRISYREMAKKLGMHPNSVIERIKKMEKEGVIEKYTVNVNYKKLGYGITALIQVDVEGKTEPSLKKIAKIPFVQSAYRTTGEYDGIVMVVCRDMDELGRIVNEINDVEGVSQVNTKIVLSDFKGCPEFNI